MKLEKLALITALLGTIILIFLSFTLEPKLIKISNINSKMFDETVKISGEITKIKAYDSFTLLNINDETENITVISYSKLNLTKSDNIEVIGKIVSYNGILEIEADKISLISS